jgi:Ser/Thr protein kinase RdoA (MazF antagonist)
MLKNLDVVGYPAPRPVRSRTGELIGVAGPWLTWATTYIPGEMLTPTHEQLRLLGAALGTLHSLPIDPAGTRAGLGSRHPDIAIPPTLSRLHSVADLVPSQLRDMHEGFRRCAETVRDQAASVPEAIVHGDVWARNAVQDASGAVTLIDWEAGGLGIAVQDLGNFLLECHLDSALPDDQPSLWLVTPDKQRIAAAAEGYASVRTLSDAELDLLPAAVMFTAAVVGAIHLEAALTSGVAGSSMDALLARLRNRVAVAEEVAALARPYLVGS